MKTLAPAASYLLCLAIALLPTLATAESVTIAPSKDSTLYEDVNGETSNGSGQFIFAGRTGSGSTRRTLFAFDVAAAVPAGATITVARLTLQLAQTSAGPKAVGIHVVTADWGEGPSDAVGGEGGGTAALDGDATWLHTFFPSQFWNTVGGDFVAAPSVVTTVDQVGPYTWASGEMVADVQGWLDDPPSNLGWMLVGDESTQATTKKFDSRDTADPALRPALTIEFEEEGDDVPAVSSWGALLLLATILASTTCILLRDRALARG